MKPFLQLIYVFTGCLWLTAIILATQEAEIRITRPYLKKTHHKIKRTGGVAQGVSPEFKPQYCKQKKKQTKKLICAIKKKKNLARGEGLREGRKPEENGGAFAKCLVRTQYYASCLARWI
jgi:hypothetical protein